MGERHEIIKLTEHCDTSSATGGLFLSRLLDEERLRVRVENWPTAVPTLQAVTEPAFSVTEAGRQSALLELDGALVHATLAGGRVFVAVAAAVEDELERALTTLHGRLPVPDPGAVHEVTVTFWTYTPHGPQPSWRTIAVPGWEDIDENYAAATRAGLERLMDGFQPAHGGQLVLWHGKAGTGKTFALRALAWEWRRWCDLHYIVDPDSFFGEHADYLMSVLLQPDHVMFARRRFVAVGDRAVEVVNDEQEEKPWRLLVLEDTGELLTPDAKAVIGQGLSRFLNVVDGLIGQGLRVLVLVTTNEPIRQLHPAVARPGRCAANVEFLPLDEEEAARWLARRDIAETPGSPEILADLYARIEGREAVEAGQAAGFAGASADR